MKNPDQIVRAGKPRRLGNHIKPGVGFGQQLLGALQPQRRQVSRKPLGKIPLEKHAEILCAHMKPRAHFGQGDPLGAVLFQVFGNRTQRIGQGGFRPGGF